MLSLFAAHDDVHGVFLILPAMGVRASYYKHFAEKLADHGMAAATIDWRGHGKSSVVASRMQDWGYSRLVEDVYDVCYYLRKRLHFDRLIILGHSMGGQVGHLTAAKYSHLIDGVIGITSSDPYYKMWPRGYRRGFYFISLLVYPISYVIGHFPGYFFNFAKREARTAIRDWARAVREGKFRFPGNNTDFRKIKSEYEGLIASISIKDDFLAPLAAVEFTLNKFKKAQCRKHVILDSNAYTHIKLNHFSWVKESSIIIQKILEILKD